VTLTAAVSQGRSLELRLRSGSAQPIGYNLCASSLERRSEAAWQPVASKRMCTMVPQGEYRATARIDGSPLQVASDPFVIR
jgi:hypothetical protein